MQKVEKQENAATAIQALARAGRGSRIVGAVLYLFIGIPASRVLLTHFHVALMFLHAQFCFEMCSGLSP